MAALVFPRRIILRLRSPPFFVPHLSVAVFFPFSLLLLFVKHLFVLAPSQRRPSCSCCFDSNMQKKTALKLSLPLE